MNRLPIYSPPPLPTGQDIRQIRSWLEAVQNSVQSCVAAVRTLQIPQPPAICPRDLGGGGADLSAFRFGYSVSGTTLTVKAGSIRVHDGRASVDAVDASFVMAGTLYTYVQWDRVAGTAVIYASAVLPSSTVNVLVCPLQRFSDTTLVAIYHIGDLNFDVPLR
jgi:hypothetical protein